MAKLKKLLIASTFVGVGSLGLMSFTPSLEDNSTPTSVSTSVETETSTSTETENEESGITWESFINSAEGIFTMVFGSVSTASLVGFLVMIVKAVKGDATARKQVEKALREQEQKFEECLIDKMQTMLKSNQINNDMIRALVKVAIFQMENTATSKQAIINILDDLKVIEPIIIEKIVKVVEEEILQATKKE